MGILALIIVLWVFLRDEEPSHSYNDNNVYIINFDCDCNDEDTMRISYERI